MQKQAMTESIDFLKAFMITNSIDTFFVNDDPEGISGEQGLFFECADRDIYELLNDNEESGWDDFVQAIFGSLNQLVDGYPCAQIAGHFHLKGQELSFEKRTQYHHH